MAMFGEFQALDEEVKELLQNYRHKRATAYEPCTLTNFKECLVGLHEEFGLLNINYIFNPYLDVDGNTLRPEAVVNLTNCVWTLLHTYKNLQQKTDALEERNHILEHNNKHLSVSVVKLKDKINFEKNESKACVASSQRIADHSDDVLQRLTETRATLLQVTKQKEANERKLRNEITRLKQQNEKLTDRLRDKDVHTHSDKKSYVVCRNITSDREEYIKHLKGIVNKLDKNNQMLMQEVLKLKDELILRGMDQFTLDKE